METIKRADLYARTKKNTLYLKPLDRKYAVSIARTLATGFENVNLQKEPSDRQYYKARKVIETWFDGINSGKYETVKPTARNRKYYAEFSDMPKNFKYYPMPVAQKGDKFRVNKKKGKLIRKGKNLNTEEYLFPDIKEAVINPVSETEKLLKEIEKDYKGVITQVHIKTGKHQTKTTYLLEDVATEVEKWSLIYNHFEQFAKGLRVFSFNGQQKSAPSNLKLKKDKKSNGKNKKIRNN